MVSAPEAPVLASLPRVVEAAEQLPVLPVEATVPEEETRDAEPPE